jgi:hypothetical protein
MYNLFHIYFYFLFFLIYSLFSVNYLHLVHPLVLQNIKRKNFPVCIWVITHYAIKFLPFLASALVRLRPRCFITGDTDPHTRWTGGWVGLITALDSMEKRMIPYFCRELNPDPSGRPARSLVAVLTYPCFLPFKYCPIFYMCSVCSFNYISIY